MEVWHVTTTITVACLHRSARYRVCVFSQQPVTSGCAADGHQRIAIHAAHQHSGRRLRRPTRPLNLRRQKSRQPIEPPQPTETSAPTATLTRTPRPRSTAATVRPRNTATPLNVTYEVVEIKRKSGDEATLTLKVYATGGSGGYRYYHDDIQQPGATFNIAGTCGKPFVHTIKVTSGDGQTVAVPYHVSGVCPTPTP